MSSKRGFIINLVIVVVALAILNYYFGDKLKDILLSQKTKDFLSGVWGFVMHIWTNYLYIPIREVWQKVVLGIIWPTLQNLMSKVRQYK